MSLDEIDEMQSNIILRKEMIKIMENQIRDGTSPETKETLDRLMIL